MKKLFVFLLVVVAVLVGLFHFLQVDKALTEAPPRQASKVALKPVTSYLSIPYSIDLKGLEQSLNESISNPIDTINKKCELIKGKRIKANAQCVGEVTKRGPVTLVGSDKGITITLPIAFRLTAKTRGFIKMQETATGAMTVSATITPGMKANWEPNATLSADFHWDKKPQIKLFGIKITFASLVEPKLRKRLNEVVTRFNERIKTKLAIRDKAQQAWSQMSQPKSLSQDPPVWLSTQLENVYFEPFDIKTHSISGSVGMQAKVHTLFGQPEKASFAKTLPELKLTPYPKKGFSLRVPVVLRFDALRQFMNQKVANKTVPLDGKNGELSLTIKEVDLYPSGENIALAVRFKAAGENQLLATQGTFHITGKPVFEETKVDGKTKVTVSLVNVQFGRKVDSTVLNIGTWVLQTAVQQYLAEAFVADVTDKFIEARQKAEQKLNQDLGNGASIKGKLNKATLETIGVSQDWLVINTLVSGQFKVKVAL